MRLFLVEGEVGPISIQTNFEVACGLLKDKSGLITELLPDTVYPAGIGACQHWHFPDEGE